MSREFANNVSQRLLQIARYLKDTLFFSLLFLEKLLSSSWTTLHDQTNVTVLQRAKRISSKRIKQKGWCPFYNCMWLSTLLHFRSAWMCRFTSSILAAETEHPVNKAIPIETSSIGIQIKAFICKNFKCYLNCCALAVLLSCLVSAVDAHYTRK